MEDFCVKFNCLLNQWQNEKQRDYLDDTLLPRLNDILENMFSKDCDVVEFLRRTEFLSICQIYLEQLISLPEDVNIQILTFIIRSLGTFLSSEEAFTYVEKYSHILPLLSNICSNPFISYDMSAQSSLLVCLSNIVKHTTGLNWTLQIKSLTVNVFETFNTPSFHVREDAKNFLSNLFVNWYLEDLDESQVKNLFDSLIRNSIYPLIKNQDVHPAAKNCGVSLLRIYLEKNRTLRFLLCKKYRLLEELIMYVKSTVDDSRTMSDLMTLQTCSEPIILLLADSFIYSRACNLETMGNFVDFLIQSPLLPSAMVLITSLLTQENGEIHISSEQFNVVLWPLLKYLKICTTDNLTISEKYQARLNSITDSKEQSLLLKTSLMCCKKMLRHPNTTVSCRIIEVMATFFIALDDNVHFGDELCGNKKLTDFLVELINLSTVIDPNELKCGKELIGRILAGLISVIKISPDPHVSACCLIAIRKYAEKSDELFLLFEELSEILVRQLYSRHSFIVESCLEIIQHLVIKCTEVHEPWVKLLCSHQIFSTVWDIVGNASMDLDVRAKAIEVLNCFTGNRHLWNELVKSKAVDEVKFVEFLFKVGEIEDYTITKAVLAIFPFLLTICTADSDHRFTMYLVLGKVLRASLDHDCQILALCVLQCIAESFIASAAGIPKNEAAQKIVRNLAVSGYCSSLLMVVNDENLIVRKKALQMLLCLRKTMVDMGVCEQSFVNVKSENMDSSCPELEDFATSVYTLQEKNEGINDVLNTPTSDQLKRILVLESVPFLSIHGDRVIDEGHPNTSIDYVFWKYLWSSQLEENLTFCNEPSDPYERNPISLLEDLIVAKKEVCDVSEEYLNIDCY